jgi:Uma2 family endonuclease
MVAVQHRLYTVSDYEAWVNLPENADRRFELIHGEIVEKVPTEEHALIAAMIAHLILSYILPRNLGRVGVEPRHQMELDAHNARLPDVTFTSTERAGSVVTKGAIFYMPDLAIEVQSPDDRPREMRQKADYYLRNGTRLVWLVYPPSRSAEVCTLTSDGILHIQTVDAEGTLVGQDVIPGLSIPVREIFQQVNK